MKRKASSLIELLIALTVTAVGVVGMFSLYGYAQGLGQNQRISAMASQLARADIEKAKVLGFANLPVGTTDFSRTKGVWTGTVEHFDADGAPLANSTGSFYNLQRSIEDRGIASSGSTYTLKDSSLRTVKTVVKRTSTGEILVTMGTNLVKGGL